MNFHNGWTHLPNQRVEPSARWDRFWRNLRLLHWLIHDVVIPFAEEFSYVGVAISILLTGLGLPCPEDVLLLAGGYLVYRHEGSLAIMAMVSVASVLAGDLIMFGLGRRFGREILHWGPLRRWLPPERLAKVEKFTLRHGKAAIFFGRFAAGLRPGIFLLAGTMQMSAGRFLAMDSLAAVLSVPALVWAGMHFGQDIDGAVEEIAAIKMKVVLGLLFVGLCWIWWKYRRGTTATGTPRPAAAEETPDGGE